MENEGLVAQVVSQITEEPDTVAVDNTHEAMSTSVEALLKAAQFLEENSFRDRTPRRRNRYKRPANYSRLTHNLLEKHRRAQLRDCLEILRSQVPFTDKLTTLSLLQSARKYIEILRTQEHEQITKKTELRLQNERLAKQLMELGAQPMLIQPQAKKQRDEDVIVDVDESDSESSASATSDGGTSHTTKAVAADKVPSGAAAATTN